LLLSILLNAFSHNCIRIRVRMRGACVAGAAMCRFSVRLIWQFFDLTILCKFWKRGLCTHEYM